MAALFSASFSAVLVLFLFIVAGFISCKAKILPDNTVTVLSRLESCVIIPSTVFGTFTKYCTVESFAEHSGLVVYGTIVWVAAAVLGHFLTNFFAEKGCYTRGVYQYALTYANSGFMGMPLVKAVMGEEALYWYMIFLLPLNLVTYSHGLSLFQPKNEQQKLNLKDMFLNPIILTLLFSMMIGLCGLSKYIPAFFQTAVADCSACLGPIAMFLAGFCIGGYRITGLLKNKKVYLATLLRLIVLPLVFILGLRAVCAGKISLQMTLFAYATPLGMNTIVFPAAYGGETETGASMVLISHTLCLLTIPLMYTVLQGVILR